MSKDSDKRRRGTSPCDFLLIYGKIAAAPAIIIGLITLGDLLGKDGFSPKRLVIIIVCVLVIAALLLVEKYEDSIRKHFDKAQCDAADAKASNSPMPDKHVSRASEEPSLAGNAIPVSEEPKPAGNVVPVSEEPSPAGNAIPVSEEPSSAGNVIPVSEKPKPAGNVAPVSEEPKPARHAVPVSERSDRIESVGTKWQIGWVSGILDDIGLVYEKAEEDESIAQSLARLESLALDEARQYCDMFSASTERLTSETFDGLSAADKEAVIVLLGEKGLQAKNTDVANREIVVTLSPVFQSILGCTMFKLLNWVEKLDGALNEMVDGKVTLTFQVPLGGRKGLVQWEMLIMRLYPWLGIREISSSFIAVPLSDVKKDADAVENTAQPSSSAQSFNSQGMTKDDAVRLLRGKIIAELSKKPRTKFELHGLLWDDASKYFPNWDGAWFDLDLLTGKLSVHVSTYPNQFGASRDAAFALGASEFHRIALQSGFSQELQQFESEEDWARLFDDTLNTAVATAHTEVQRQEQEKQAEQSEKYAIRIPYGSTTGSPGMSIKRIVLELNQRYGCSKLTLIREKDTYLLVYTLTYTSTTNNQSYRRTVNAAEASWIEERVDRAIDDPDRSTWQSLPGGDTMNIVIAREKKGDVELKGVKPIRKYSNLLNELGKLAQYGSIEAGGGTSP